MDGLKKISITNNGLKDDVIELLSLKCKAYIAEGKFNKSGIPTTKTALSALIDSETGVFITLGEMDGSGNKITSTPKLYETALRTAQTGEDLEGNFILLNVNSKSLNFADALINKVCTLLFIPDAYDDIYLIYNGVTITSAKEIPLGDGDSIAKISLNAKRKVNKFTDAVFLMNLED